MYYKRSGFTIVELLVVIVVIAILASVTVVAFNGIQQRAKSAAYVNGLQSWEKLLRIQSITDGQWYSTGGFSVCLGNGFKVADGFASGQCVRSIPASFFSATESAPFSASIANVNNTVPNGSLPVVETVDPAQSNRQVIVRGLVYSYNAAGSTKPYIEYYLDKSTGSAGCIGSDNLEYGGYADGAKRCRRYMQ